MNNRLLPIGTVLTLTNRSQKVMIIGYMAECPNEKYEYYKAVNFPVGEKDNNIISFNPEKIDEIYFMGYQTASTLSFQESLKIIIDKLNSEEVL